LLALIRGRISLRRAARNFAAAVALPLVHLRLLPDPWLKFDRYLVIERGKAATYFFIPRRGHAGRTRKGSAPAKRAAAYAVESLGDRMRLLTAAGNELGVHGLDAWLDGVDGRSERAIVTAAAGTEPGGVRMHWLYFDAGSPVALDAAGFDYDSTFGYNRTVGFRAGTGQVFQPPGVKHLLELPLHVMDTALFYPESLNLTDDQAVEQTGKLAGQFSEFGGALTINWHDRSVAPERQWDHAYERILRLLETRGAWFPSCGQAVSWFRHRRAVTFEETTSADGARRIRVRLDKPNRGPNLKLRVHRPPPAPSSRPLAERPAVPFEDIAIVDGQEMTFAQ
jgi:peptidoglycan/xylan/chitin deacetylase (PgdA/CDA1 family)